MALIRRQSRLSLGGHHGIDLDEKNDLIMYRKKSLPLHPNGMCFIAFDDKSKLQSRYFYSVGGGFVVDDLQLSASNLDGGEKLPYPFESGKELLALCEQKQCNISEIMLSNESAFRLPEETQNALLEIWEAMQACVIKGCQTTGILPGGMKVKRRAAALYQDLLKGTEASLCDPLSAMDWVNLYALAVNEENAAGGRIVTAPTNGAAGIIPAVLHYYMRFCREFTEEGVIRFLLTAGAIGVLYKKNASISGAEVGCQGEVGSACSMAAGALTEVMGGTPMQVENAAEIAMEHNLGLTCDPIGGLVQVPCIERNAMGAVKAINAARIALRGNGLHFVSLDKVINTMRITGKDMKRKYKETSRGGLAVDIIEMPVNFPEC